MRSSYVPSQDHPIESWRIKHAVDAVLATGALIVLWPLLIVLAVCIKLCDGGAVLYRQQRIGEGGRPFCMYKFRTMHIGAEEALTGHLLASPELRQEWMRYQKLQSDPRVTGIGSWLRRCSLDELPQLWNVVCGDMSLVGPRPILPEQRDGYGPAFLDYCKVRPGLTGPWQVLGRSELSFSKRVRLESSYVRQWSWQRDVAILLRTVPAVIRKGRAF